MKLTKVALEDDGKIQYVRYSAAPKACGFKDGSSLGTKKLDGGGYKLSDGAKIPVPIPEQYIADNVKEGVYMIHDNFLPRYVYPSPYPAAPGGNWFYAFRDDYGGYGEVVIVPSRWQVFDDEYYHKESDVSFWVGTDSLIKGTSVTVHFIDCTFDEIENPAKEYIDCKMSADGYMVSGWIMDTDGNRYFLHDELDGTQGYMYTGWHEIDGKWYYFSEETGGPLGSLRVNGTTPDGCEVGADGARIS